MTASADPVGLWQLAGAEPGRVAVVDPDGTITSRGELAVLANRLSHGVQDPDAVIHQMCRTCGRAYSALSTSGHR